MASRHEMKRFRRNLVGRVPSRGVPVPFCFDGYAFPIFLSPFPPFPAKFVLIREIRVFISFFLPLRLCVRIRVHRCSSVASVVKSCLLPSKKV